MTNYTFASDEERERFELDQIAAHGDTLTDHETRLDAAETTIADHETRIDTLEGGGGGGMAETMWAQFVLDVAVGPGSGSAGGDWVFLDSLGTDPPTLWASDESYLLIEAAGYHLVTVLVSTGDSLSAGEEFAAEINGLGSFHFDTPSYRETGLYQRAEARITVPMHLEPTSPESSGFTCTVRYNDFAAEHGVSVLLGLSRIGTYVTGADAYPLV